MTREQRPYREYCQAEVHDPSLKGQPHYSENMDHLTPRCMILDSLLDLDPGILDDPDNLIPMHYLCHALKDRYTALIHRERREQAKGKFIGLGEHIEVRMKHGS